MKFLKLAFVLAVIVAASGFLLSVKHATEEKHGIVKSEKQLRHVVLFKFKDNTTKEDIKKVEDAFRALPSKIKEIKGFEWGTNNSPENLAQGFTHCFFVTFADEKGREVYLPHPAHKEFSKILGPYLDKVLVVDYWATK